MLPHREGELAPRRHQLAFHILEYRVLVVASVEGEVQVPVEIMVGFLGVLFQKLVAVNWRLFLFQILGLLDHLAFRCRAKVEVSSVQLHE